MATWHSINRGPLGGERSLELPMELLRRCGARRGHAETRRHLHPIERRIVEVEHGLRLGVHDLLANPRHLDSILYLK